MLPYSFNTPNEFHAPPPQASNPTRHALSKEQADAVLAASASMTDRQKMISELFENKITSLGFSSLFITVSQNM